MRFLTGQAALSKGLGLTKNAIASAHSLDQLKHVKIDAEEDGVTFMATNTEIAIVAKIDAMVEETGSLTVSHALFSRMISSLDSAAIEIYTTEKTPTTLRIKSEKQRFQTSGLDSGTYPTLPTVDADSGVKLSLDPNIFKSALRHVVFSASEDMDRPILRSINFKFADGRLKLAAADGHRLAVYDYEIDNPIGELDINVPVDAVKTVISTISDEDEEVLLYVADDRRHAMFLTDTVIIAATLMQGDFPDYEPLVNDNSKTVVEIQNSKAQAVVNSASVFAREVNGAVKITASDNKIDLLVDASEIGSYDGSADCEKITGEDNNIALRSPYLNDFFTIARSTPGAVVTFGIEDEKTKCVLRIVGNDDYVYILMPMFVSW